MKSVNINQLIAQLSELSDGEVVPILQTQMAKATRWVRDDARLRAPVDTGALRQSITAQTTNTPHGAQGVVGTNIEYAAYVEFGTGQAGEATNTQKGISYRQDWQGQPAQPYLYPALKENEDEIRREFFEKPLRRKIREEFG